MKLPIGRALALSAAIALPAAAERATVLANVTVIDAAGARAGQSIVIVADRIEAVGPAATVTIPPGAQVVEGGSGFVIPGLWEMHAHLASYSGALPLLVAYGVTGVRDMGDASPEQTVELVAWRREIAAQRRVGPRLVIAGATIDGPRGFNDAGRLFVSTAAEGRQAVATVLERGGDFVKVHNGIRPEAYAAVLAAARESGLRVAGHTPWAIPARDVAAAGQVSIEHLSGFVLEASSREGALRRELLVHMDEAVRAGSEDAFSKWVLAPARTKALLDSWDPAKARELIAVYKRNGTWHCPTLTVVSPTPRPRGEHERRLVFASTVAACIKASPPVASPDVAQRLFRRQLGIVADLQRAGVGLLTGTDVSAPNAEAVEEFGTCDMPLAGISVHEELEWLVAAGLSPREALAAATLGPARYFDEEATAGSIAAGKRADLVVLDANPLDDIRNTRLIRVVVAGGRLFDRVALDGLLEQAAADARAR